MRSPRGSWRGSREVDLGKHDARGSMWGRGGEEKRKEGEEGAEGVGRGGERRKDRQQGEEE